MNKHIEELKRYAASLELDVFKLANEILDDPRFELWPASIDKHHMESGGLARHTYEVFDIAWNAATTTGHHKDIEVAVLYLAALFHDVGKFHDYIPTYPDKPHIKEWKKSDHCRLIHHISRSALVWSSMVCKYPKLYDRYHDKVLHCILAHHGCRAWGSPVAPSTREAWLVHLADAISARADDCDRVDMLKVDQEKKG